MKSAFRKRLDRLTHSRGETLRIVSVRDGEPKPEAAPGELLVVIRKFCEPESERK
jgi:hypothetical protein